MLRSTISQGDVARTSWPVRMSDHLNLYLGSGRAGACFDVWGLIHGKRPHGSRASESQARTVFMHADHWHRGAYGLDYWLPVARLCWADGEPPEPASYRQHLDLYDARLETELVWPGLRILFRSWFNPDRRDLLAVEVQYQASAGCRMPDIVLAPETDIHTHYDQHVTGSFAELEASPTLWVGRVTVGTADSVLALRVATADGVQACIHPGADGPVVSFPGQRGRHLLLIGSAAAARRDELLSDIQRVPPPEQYAAEAAQAWHRRWGSAAVSIPVSEYQALWSRSHYYVLCSHAPEVRSPAPPMGWSGGGWPFHFPQDASYVHPALLRLGHLDIAKAWVEFYRSYLDRTIEVTKRIYKVDGAMWAWEHPIGPDTEMLTDEAPNWFQFEIHNAAYPLRMAYETSLYLHDEEWTREVAWPVIRESARFYGSSLKPEGDGKWGLHIIPSMGQDEKGGRDKKNYLCALYSARYSLSVATRLAHELGIEGPEYDAWRRILADGLAFNRLYIPELGFCVTCEGMDGRNMIGRQKHPVQLNPLTFLPLDQPEDHVLEAYRRRYDICTRPGENYFDGWTLAAYWLASSHVGDTDGLLAGIAQALPARYVDPNWIQIYETSGSTHMPYYVTSHGLFLQAICDALVSDYWDGEMIGKACPPTWQEVSFQNLRTADASLSGTRRGREWDVQREYA